MPTYEFERRNGTRIEAYFTHDAAPAIGEYVVIGNETVRRVASDLQVQKPKEYAHVARTAPPWHPAAKRHDPMGAPVFETKKEVAEFSAKTGLKWDP